MPRSVVDARLVRFSQTCDTKMYQKVKFICLNICIESLYSSTRILPLVPFLDAAVMVWGECRSPRLTIQVGVGQSLSGSQLYLGARWLGRSEGGM